MEGFGELMGFFWIAGDGDAYLRWGLGKLVEVCGGGGFTAGFYCEAEFGDGEFNGRNVVVIENPGVGGGGAGRVVTTSSPEAESVDVA